MYLCLVAASKDPITYSAERDRRDVRKSRSHKKKTSHARVEAGSGARVCEKQKAGVTPRRADSARNNARSAEINGSRKAVQPGFAPRKSVPPVRCRLRKRPGWRSDGRCDSDPRSWRGRREVGNRGVSSRGRRLRTKSDAIGGV